MALTQECTRNLEIEIPAGEVERENLRIAQGIQRRARIPGFRPGKAPLTLVRKHFGEKIREEMLEALVPAHLRSAFERASLEPVSTPTLEDLHYVDGEPIKFRAIFEVLPVIELGDYRSIKAELAAVAVKPEEVDAALEALRERSAKREEIDDAAGVEVADGMVARVAATRHDPATEPSAPPAEAQELPIEVGAAETLPEFNAALRGMRVGEERHLEVTYPAEYPNSAFAGKTLQYHLKLNGIQRKIMPELSDAFVKEATGAETVAELRERISSNLLAERSHDARHKAEDAILDQLLAQSPFPVPDSLVEKQVDNKLERGLHGLADQGIDPRKLKLDWTKLRAKYQDGAEREVRVSLLLDKIAERENIAATPADIDAEVARAATETKQSPEAVRTRLTDNGVLDRIKNRIRQERVLSFLLDSATSGASASASQPDPPPDRNAGK